MSTLSDEPHHPIRKTRIFHVEPLFGQVQVEVLVPALFSPGRVLESVFRALDFIEQVVVLFPVEQLKLVQWKMRREQSTWNGEIIRRQIRFFLELTFRELLGYKDAPCCKEAGHKLKKYATWSVTKFGTWARTENCATGAPFAEFR